MLHVASCNYIMLQCANIDIKKTVLLYIIDFQNIIIEYYAYVLHKILRLLYDKRKKKRKEKSYHRTQTLNAPELLHVTYCRKVNSFFNLFSLIITRYQLSTRVYDNPHRKKRLLSKYYIYFYNRTKLATKH